MCGFVGVTDLEAMPFFDFNTNTANIEVTWGAAESSYCGRVLYYIAMISSNEYSNIMNNLVNVTVPTASENVFITTFSNLRNDTNYNIAVFAVNREGDGITTTKMNIILHSPSMTQRTTSMCIIISKHKTIYS